MCEEKNFICLIINFLKKIFVWNVIHTPHFLSIFIIQTNIAKEYEPQWYQFITVQWRNETTVAIFCLEIFFQALRKTDYIFIHRLLPTHYHNLRIKDNIILLPKQCENANCLHKQFSCSAEKKNNWISAHMSTYTENFHGKLHKWTHIMYI